jgi:transposase
LPQVSSVPQLPLSPKQELLILDHWQRSGLPARDFSALVNMSHHTLYSWKKRFEEQGTAGLTDRPKGAQTGSKLPELTKRTILMLKQAHPETTEPDAATSGGGARAWCSGTGRLEDAVVPRGLGC